ncbi:MAG: serine/threonine-protein kinase [Deltaproteobacteria bacterium]|nr:serine/threonine-protein kinase [Deltaproteobacteria bacterium]
MTAENEEGLAEVVADVVQERSGLRLVSRLGHGGMADIFLGVQTGEQGFARLVVVKKIRARRADEGGADDLRLLGMFFDEAKTVAALSHPHIVKVYDLTRTDGGDIAIVMEYVDGETLSYVWRQLGKNGAQMPVPVILKLMLDAAEALGAAHTATSPDGKALALIHRDVSPQNLMIDKNGYLKVIDFGIAKTNQQTELTSPGGIKGKLSYLAPETFRVRDIDGRVDVYGLGLVLWELLTLKSGLDLPKDAPLQEIVDHVDQLKLTPASSLRPDVPTELDDVVNRATHPDRDLRYATMDDFAAGLRKISAKTGISSAAGVKKWFNATFTHRLEKRRAFEADAFARADKPLPASSTLPVVRVETTMHAAQVAPALIDPKDPKDARPPTPLTELGRKGMASSSSSSVLSSSIRWPFKLALVAFVTIVLGVINSVRTAQATIAVVDAGSIAAVVVDAGSIELATASPIDADDLPESPPVVEPPKKIKKPIATTTTTTAVVPEPAPVVVAPPPVVLPPPPVVVAAPPPVVVARPALYSNNGSWTGTQVLQNGCKKCHTVDVKAKTRRQWERFFERDVHDRHKKLDEVFSAGEQQRALQSILLLVDDKAGSSGVAGVR